MTKFTKTVTDVLAVAAVVTLVLQSTSMPAGS